MKSFAFEVVAARAQNWAPGQEQVGNRGRNFWEMGKGRA